MPVRLQPPVSCNVPDEEIMTAIGTALDLGVSSLRLVGPTSAPRSQSQVSGSALPAALFPRHVLRQVQTPHSARRGRCQAAYDLRVYRPHERARDRTRRGPLRRHLVRAAARAHAEKDDGGRSRREGARGRRASRRRCAASSSGRQRPRCELDAALARARARRRGQGWQERVEHREEPERPACRSALRSLTCSLHLGWRHTLPSRRSSPSSGYIRYRDRAQRCCCFMHSDTALGMQFSFLALTAH